MVMLCEKVSREDAERLCDEEGWMIERKHDGIRAFCTEKGIFDRRGNEITSKFPEFVPPFPNNIDGEIVAQSGIFEDVSGRIHMKDKFLIGVHAKKSPAIFMAFDKVDDKPWVSLKARREALDKAVLPVWMHKSKVYKDFNEAWSEVEAKGYEGLVIKDPDSLYVHKRSHAWKKCKAFEETTAMFTKLETHNRGVRLETADGKSVNVNGVQAKKVKELFDKNGSVECEVQFLPQQNSAAWRFPSFRKLIEAHVEVRK